MTYPYTDPACRNAYPDVDDHGTVAYPASDYSESQNVCRTRFGRADVGGVGCVDCVGLVEENKAVGKGVYDESLPREGTIARAAVAVADVVAGVGDGGGDAGGSGRSIYWRPCRSSCGPGRGLV